MTDKLKREDCTPCEIIPNLYIGSIGAAYNRDTLESRDISHVLICASCIEPLFPTVFEYEHLPLRDSQDEDLNPHLEKAHKFIDKAIQSGTGVLVHCFKGQSRSAAIIVSYLIKSRKMSLNDAISSVKKG